MRQITLTQNKLAIVSDQDFARLNVHRWHACEGGKNGLFYARRKELGKLVYMHHAIRPTPKGFQIDHRDGDGLNNRRKNLRIATSTQNKQAKRRKPNGCSSRFRGVYWNTRKKKWLAQIYKRIDGVSKRFYAGSFTSEIEAAHAYDTLAKKLFGRFASPNFPVRADSSECCSAADPGPVLDRPSVCPTQDS